MEGHSFPRAFERREKFLYLGKFFFMRNLSDILKKAPLTGSSLHRGPVGEPGVGVLYWNF